MQPKRPVHLYTQLDNIRYNSRFPSISLYCYYLRSHLESLLGIMRLEMDIIVRFSIHSYI